MRYDTGSYKDVVSNGSTNSSPSVRNKRKSSTKKTAAKNRVSKNSRQKNTPLNYISDKFRPLKSWSEAHTPSVNSIIHGDNLEILDELNEKMPGAVKCAYIDPPYNNGEKYTHYVDTMGHDKWLDSVTQRIHRIHRLLKNDGSLWISIDDTGMHYLKVAADSVFGRANFIGTVIWEHRTTRENRRIFSNNHEYILVYAKNIESLKKVVNTLPITDDIKDRYKNPDNDKRGPWQSVSANVQDGHATPQQFYELVAPNGKKHTPPKGRCWCYSKKKMQEEIKKNNIWFGRDGNGAPRLKKFLSERKVGIVPETLWRADEVGTTSDAKKHLLELFPDISLFDTPKPEPLIQRILHISTNPGDLVLDAYLGSGTTTAVAHKMGRNYIGIENGEHSKTHCANRMKKVIKGEQGGISKIIKWSGGGEFNFYRFTKKK